MVANDLFRHFLRIISISAIMKNHFPKGIIQWNLSHNRDYEYINIAEIEIIKVLLFFFFFFVCLFVCFCFCFCFFLVWF